MPASIITQHELCEASINVLHQRSNHLQKNKDLAPTVGEMIMAV